MANEAEKRRLAETYGGMLVDMESATIARLAQMRGIPVCCMKIDYETDVSARLPNLNPFISAMGQMRDGEIDWARAFAIPAIGLRLMRIGQGKCEAGRIIWPLQFFTFSSMTRPRNLHEMIRDRWRFRRMISETDSLPTIPATMRAAVYRGVNDVRVETVPVPLDADGTIGAGEVLVRIDTCGICGTDLKKIHSGSHSAPRIFGHEMAGTIAMVGEGVTGLRLATA